MPNENIDFKGIGYAAAADTTGTPAPTTPEQKAAVVTPTHVNVSPTGQVAPAVQPPNVDAPLQSGQAPAPPGTQTPNQVAAPVVPNQNPPAVQTFDVDFGDGRIEKLTAQQIREGYLRQQDYTKKTTDVAQQRRELENAANQLGQYNQQVQLARQLLSNPQTALQWAQSQLAAQQPQVPIDPNKPLTYGELQQELQRVNQRVESFEQRAFQQLQQVQQAGQQYVQDQMQVADYGTTINQTLNKLYEENPVLKLDPNFEDMLRYKVTQQAPDSVESAIALFKEEGKKFADNLTNFYQSKFQNQQAQVQNLANTGIERPGGSAPPIPAQKFVKKDKLDWSSLKQAVKNNYSQSGQQ